ncbi:hypothetical protein E2C01_076431 [Portunus trituberculatus]|uniref:Uncharacterized protein n=1 Tax=Portunus trituberculatus TaxID=210409 RepID=A0A5B7IJR9_PORTR|nr:hypothetical protein [Portunus trituberculatus]
MKLSPPSSPRHFVPFSAASRSKIVVPFNFSPPLRLLPFASPCLVLPSAPPPSAAPPIPLTPLPSLRGWRSQSLDIRLLSEILSWSL